MMSFLYRWMAQPQGLFHHPGAIGDHILTLEAHFCTFESVMSSPDDIYSPSLGHGLGQEQILIYHTM